MPALKLLSVFALMMVLLWLRVPLAPVIFGSSCLLAILYHLTSTALLATFWQTLTDPSTIELELVLVLIMLFEGLLKKHGYLERMLAGLLNLLPNRRLLAATLPAFIGLMPSMGGAFFSAPLVAQATADTTLSPEEKSVINYYYRHIWEYCLPLYPSLLITSQVCELPLTKLIQALAPYGLLVALLGWPFLRRIPAEKNRPGNGSLPRIKEVLLNILPVLVIVLMVLLLQVRILIAVGLVLVVLLVRHRYTPRQFLHLFREAVQVKILVLVLGIFFFKQTILATGAVASLSYFLEALAVPEFIVFSIFGLLVGLITGTVSYSMGIIFPVVVAATGGQVSMPLAVFVFIAGFTGAMFTPMHLCLSLTVDFFHADLRQVLRMLVLPEAALIAVAATVYIIAV
ncbi:DUF401 family protein [Moorella sulfitireducens]|uniref:DUF401 family protein n=1 Tax=Neomoorella sulfitireducens TaxID=2972948 RepID=UPI0021ABD479|nr:DUF401 family protein [Moorella sulfitireducens]